MKKRKPNGDGIANAINKTMEKAAGGEAWRAQVTKIIEATRDGSPLERNEGLIQAAKIMREVGAMDGGYAVFMVAHPIISIAENRIMNEQGPALNKLLDKMTAIEKAHGLADDEYWARGDAPPEYEELNEKYNHITHSITAATFDEYGEYELGIMYRHDEDRFDELFEQGRQIVFRPKPRK